MTYENDTSRLWNIIVVVVVRFDIDGCLHN